ncbi:MAG: glycoside hydrolase family 32 protein [Actinobacteria bacterium]|nr:glycoside hydrolase family 32 protein [Actinomycetota bacterium]
MTAGPSGEDDAQHDRQHDPQRPTPWWRPRIHATPARAWMNDPNGLILDGGRYHLFFQHHPDGVVWGPMSWGHATSPDLVRWTEEPVAIAATPTEHVFSGCAVRDGDRLVAVYTSVDPATQVQSQALATSVDGGTTWERHPKNPVLDIGSTQWRDPKVFRHSGSGEPGRDDAWVMVLVRAADRVVEVWRSGDLLDWERTGTVGPYDVPSGVTPGEPFFWEMPDLVRLPVVDEPGRSEWVLLLSVNPGGPAGGSGQAYAVGRFDGRAFAPDPLPGNAFGPFSWADHGPDLYAASTFSGLPDGDPPLWVGWMSNWLYADRTPTSPWRGAATLARSLALQEVEGRPRLVQRPVLPTGRDVSSSAALPDAALVRIEVSIPPGGTAGVDVLVPQAGTERTRVLVEHPADGAPHLVVDRTRSGTAAVYPAFPARITAPLPGVRPGPDGLLTTTVDVVVDTSSVEVFAAGGATSVTALVFPPPGSRGLAAVASGGGTVEVATLRDLGP